MILSVLKNGIGILHENNKIKDSTIYLYEWKSPDGIYSFMAGNNH